MMKLLILFLTCFLSLTSPDWLKDLDQAKKISRESHKNILLNFSGSDWCGPCIKLEKDIFESESFKTYANENLVLVNADFPRLKKNQLDKKQVQLNEKMADAYNKTGVFPLTLLLNSEGKVIKKWEGMPAKQPKDFIAQIQAVNTLK